MISNATDLTTERLTTILAEQGVLDGGSVSDVRAITSVNTQISTIHRLVVEYDGPATDAPRQLVLKVSRMHPENLGLGPVSSSEVEFYRELGKKMPEGPLIRFYGGEYDATTQRCFLLLEDLWDTHTQPRDPKPPSERLSIAAVGALAQIHARWWDDPALGKGIGSIMSTEQLTIFTDNVAASVTRFLKDVDVDSSTREFLGLLVDHRDQIWGRLTDPAGLTVTHGDAHWWNFLYPRRGMGDRVRIFDWQLWHIDVGARDLAFLVSLGGFAELRPKLEPVLLRHYHDVLTQNGVHKPSWDRFLDDYRWGTVRNLNIPVIFWSQGRSQELWRKVLRRAVTGFKALDCRSLFD